MKIHFFSIIKYILVFILIVVFILVFKQNYLVFLLFPYILIPAVTIPLFLFNVNKISLSGGSEMTETENGGNIMFFVEYNNPTYLPFLKCALKFSVTNLFVNREMKSRVNFSMLMNGSDRIRVNVGTGMTGMTAFDADTLEVTDFLGILTKKIDTPISVRVPVLPTDGAERQVQEIPYSEGYDEYSEPDMKGSISSETKEIREYRPGDRINRIHWKLSTKLDQLMVKEPDRTSSMSVVIVAEMTAGVIQSTVATLHEVALDLCGKGERFEICLFNNASCETKFYRIDNRETLNSCYGDMFLLPLYEARDAAMNAYGVTSGRSAIMLHICGNSVKMYDEGVDITEEF